jgi:hypothetical protein
MKPTMPAPSVAIDAAQPTAQALGQLHLAESLSRCCGKERATLGPLFGKIAIGEGFVEELPENLRPENVGMTISFFTGEGQFGMYIDGVDIEIPGHDVCAQLQQRLEKAWGRGEWANPARHQSAGLTWASPETDHVACSLHIDRTATRDPAHCLRDERPHRVQEIDVKRRCLKRSHAVGCMLDRDRGRFPEPSCMVDDVHHTFWESDDELELEDGMRFCTLDELHSVDLYELRDC